MTLYRAARFWAPLAAILVLACAIPLMNSPYLTTFTFTLIIALIVAQSWDWVGGQMGFINLGHFAFYGIGGYTFAILLTGGAAIWIALAAAVVVTVIVAVIVSFPLFRLRGDYFAFATLALLPLCQILAFNLEPLTGGSAGIPLPPHYVLVPAYYLALGAAVVTFILSIVLDRVRFGYALKAIRNDEGAAALSGIRILPVKIVVLAVSAIFAGSGRCGADLATRLPRSAERLWPGSRPDPDRDGAARRLRPSCGPAVRRDRPRRRPPAPAGQADDAANDRLRSGHPAGRAVHARWPAAGVRMVRLQSGVGRGAAEPPQRTSARLPLGRPAADGPGTPERSGAALLECRGVSMVFGGNRAVNDVSLSVQRGEIIGLVGPNGSGKTTLFNCISKVYEPPSGDVLLNGRSLRRTRPDTISRLGIGRTWQIPRPFSDLTVEENVLIPLLFRDGASPPMGAALAEARDIAAFAGLGARLAKRADELSLQEKKALEFARALACKPALLLVDEVASGLTPTEVHHFIDLLRQVRDVHGVTIIWVEHIFWALAELVERLVVMENGSIIADGPLREVVQHDKVLRAYLGSQMAEAV